MVPSNRGGCCAATCVCCWSGVGSLWPWDAASVGGLGGSCVRSRPDGLSSTFARRPARVEISVCSPFTQTVPIRTDVLPVS